MRYYLVVVKTLSSGSEERALTPYDDKEVALRKFHEAFTSIGAGPTKILAKLFDEGGIPLREEVWRKEVLVTPVEE